MPQKLPDTCQTSQQGCFHLYRKLSDLETPSLFLLRQGRGGPAFAQRAFLQITSLIPLASQTRDRYRLSFPFQLPFNLDTFALKEVADSSSSEKQ
jgi:hypothetical protein